jgi:hypothetical protein
MRFTKSWSRREGALTLGSGDSTVGRADRVLETKTLFRPPRPTLLQPVHFGIVRFESPKLITATRTNHRHVAPAGSQSTPTQRLVVSFRPSSASVDCCASTCSGADSPPSATEDIQRPNCDIADMGSCSWTWCSNQHVVIGTGEKQLGLEKWGPRKSNGLRSRRVG